MIYCIITSNQWHQICGLGRVMACLNFGVGGSCGD